MTITSTIRCDLCGLEESWPRHRAIGHPEITWSEYYPDFDKPAKHCCSLECWLKNRAPGLKVES